MTWLFLIPLHTYNMLIAAFAFSHRRMRFKNSNKQYENDLTTKKLTHFSLIIPFRNEATNLPRLLAHIKALDYPKEAYEVILVNDASEDNSLAIVQEFIAQNNLLSVFGIPNKRESASPKKDAITTAIHLSKHEWIVTTDADCSFGKTWLSILSDAITQQQPKMVVGPVRIAQTEKTSFLNAFEQLDFLSLMGATLGGFGIGKPFLCNGAHLAYEKNAFLEVNGFSANDHIASGDDHFLLETFNKHFPRQITYLRSQEAFVTTQPQETWRPFISQRIRWAAKGTGYTYWFSKFVGVVVLLANTIVAVTLLFGICLFFYDLDDVGSAPFLAKALPYRLLSISILLKFLVDYWLISSTARYLQRTRYLKWFPLVMLCYPFVSGYIAIRALSGGFAWKGRRYKK